MGDPKARPLSSGASLGALAAKLKTALGDR